MLEFSRVTCPDSFASRETSSRLLRVGLHVRRLGSDLETGLVAEHGDTGSRGCFNFLFLQGRQLGYQLQFRGLLYFVSHEHH
jgi:hypothetical protein